MSNPQSIDPSADPAATMGERRPKAASLVQQDVPSFPIAQARAVADALTDHLGKQPSSPLQVAAAMELKPTTGKFRTITTSSCAYELTDGAARSESIALTPLGRRLVSPTVEGDDLAALAEAVLKPRVTREFLTRYDRNKWPKVSIGRNVLEEMGVPVEQSGRALELIHDDAAHVGFLTTINGDEFVDLSHAARPHQATGPVPVAPLGDRSDEAEVLSIESAPSAQGRGLVEPAATLPEPIAAPPSNQRVFITHGKNQSIVAQIKKILTFGKLEPVVAAENQTNAKPVPDKVMDDMRSCSAGIVHVGTEQVLMDATGKEHRVINPNVLIEIGAAMALYGRRFILLVEKGTTLPSNLQGLYEVRYEGEGLDHAATMALLEAFSSFEDPPTTD